MGLCLIFMVCLLFVVDGFELSRECVEVCVGCVDTCGMC